LIERFGVATIPLSGFYAVDKAEGRALVRFAFCKTKATLDRALERLSKLSSRAT
jgi:aspartate/methionine/tyrosine aminotransferase